MRSAPGLFAPPAWARICRGFPLLLSALIYLAFTGPAGADVDPAGDAAAGANLPSLREEAAIRGVEYLLGRAELLEPAWRVSTFETLAKIVPDDALADACREQVDAANRTPMGRLPAAFRPSLLQSPQPFRSIVLELVRRKHQGGDWQEATRILEQLLADHETVLWKILQPTQQLVVGYQLGRLGIETRRTADDVIGDLRRRWTAEDQDELLLDTGFMFGVTHVIFVRSGYFERRLDPSPYAFEIEVFERAVAAYAPQLPAQPIFIDIAAEVLSSRRLLGIPENPATLEIIRQLLALQSPEGRWGEPRLNRDIHSTLTAVQALIEYAEPFRKLGP